MRDFQSVKKEYDELIQGVDTKKEQPEKFIISLLNMYPENISLLKEYGIIKVTEGKSNFHPSDWMVLSIEPEILKKAVLRAKDLGFLEAYQQTPSFLKQDVDKVIKRIAKLDSLNIKYINEKGKYLSFLFSERGFNYVLNQSENKINSEVMDIELKEYATRVIELLGIMDKKDEVYSSLAQVEKEGLEVKETLMKVFSKYESNTDYLRSSIDMIIMNNKEVGLSR